MIGKKAGLLWQISGTRLPGPSWIFGTMHMRPHGHFPMLQIAKDKIEVSDHFAAELNLSEASLQNNQLPQQNWTQHLSPARLRKVEDILYKTAGIPRTTVRHYPPMLLVNWLTSRILVPAGSPFYLDQHLWDYAQTLGKSASGLESLQEQTEIYAAYSRKEQLSSLLRITSNISNYSRHMKKMNAYYEAGDIRKLYKHSKNGLGGMRQTMLYHRNERMTNRLMELMLDKTVFAGVGVAHLYGQYGMLRLLKHKGFKLRPAGLEELSENP
ncbi:MAG: TraB/GumN family protein [Bacteroidetes bacterium]|nr:TraB/GumN family protein [Bacteroidota bacterium]